MVQNHNSHEAEKKCNILDLSLVFDMVSLTHVLSSPYLKITGWPFTIKDIPLLNKNIKHYSLIQKFKGRKRTTLSSRKLSEIWCGLTLELMLLQWQQCMTSSILSLYSLYVFKEERKKKSWFTTMPWAMKFNK